MCFEKCGQLRHSIDFIKTEVEKRNGTLLTKKYKNNIEKLLVRCNKCFHEWNISYANIKLGRWCPKCNKKFGERLTEEYVKEEIKKRGGELLTPYVKSKLKITIKCLKCFKNWDTTYDYVKQGKWCINCLNKKIWTLELVKEEVKNRGGELLSTEYINNITKLKIKCKICGDVWEPRLINILKGNWCRNCSGTKPLTYEYVKNEIKKRNGTLLSQKYISNDSKINILCNKCKNIWSPVFSSVMAGTWCPICKVKSKKQNFIYNVLKKYFKQVEFNFFQFDWLRGEKNRKMEIDIYIPEIKLAIEYDGRQHFKPVKLYGGQEALEKTKIRDKRKNILIMKHPEDIKYFIRFNYMQKITEDFILKELLNLGINVDAKIRKEEKNE